MRRRAAPVVVVMAWGSYSGSNLLQSRTSLRSALFGLLPERRKRHVGSVACLALAICLLSPDGHVPRQTGRSGPAHRWEVVIGHECQAEPCLQKSSLSIRVPAAWGPVDPTGQVSRKDKRQAAASRVSCRTAVPPAGSPGLAHGHGLPPPDDEDAWRADAEAAHPYEGPSGLASSPSALRGAADRWSSPCYLPLSTPGSLPPSRSGWESRLSMDHENHPWGVSTPVLGF